MHAWTTSNMHPIYTPWLLALFAFGRVKENDKKNITKKSLHLAVCLCTQAIVNKDNNVLTLSAPLPRALRCMPYALLCVEKPTNNTLVWVFGWAATHAHRPSKTLRNEARGASR